MPDPSAGPQRAAEQAALRELVWSAAAGLSERDRALLDLHLRQGLEGADLGEAMGVSAGHAYVLLTRLRDQVERSLGALLIARLGRKDCPELGLLLSGWDGAFSPVMRKRVARHVDNCETCDGRRRTMVSPLALLAAVPLITAPIYLRDRVMDNVELVAYERPLKPPRPSRLPMVAAAITLLLTISLAFVWERGGTVPGSPVALDLLPDSGSAAPPSSESAQPGSTTTTAPPTTTTTTTRPGTTTTRPTTTTTTTAPQPRDTTPPTILRPLAKSDPIFIQSLQCQPKTNSVTAIVTDDVGVTSATVQWTGPDGAGSGAMTGSGSSWSGSIGPFAKPGTVTWTVIATDAAGNTGTASGGKFTVARACPIP